MTLPVKRSRVVLPVLCPMPNNSMEAPWHNLFPDMDMEDDGDFFNQSYNNNSFDDEELVLGEILLHSAFSSETQNNCAGATAAEGGSSSTLSFDDTGTGFLNNNNNKSGKLLTKSNSSNSLASRHVPLKPAISPKSYLLSFDDSNVAAATSKGNGRKHQGGGSSGSARCSSRGAHQTQIAKKARSSSESLDHIMAERKRRQELTERFIALSATIPHLKKIDKASILSQAIAYIKQLQERVKKSEEQSGKKIEVESVSFINKADLYSAEGTASNCKTNSDDCHRLNVALPEVEARALEKEVLIRIHCKNQSGVMLKILTHLGSLDLSIVSNSVLPFGNYALDITIIAQMGDKYTVTVKDLVKGLRLAFLESPDIQQ